MADKMLMRKLYKGAALTDIQLLETTLKEMLEIESPQQCLKIAEAIKRLDDVRRLVQGKDAPPEPPKEQS